MHCNGSRRRLGGHSREEGLAKERDRPTADMCGSVDQNLPRTIATDSNVQCCRTAV
jgi:hypothetical protein